MSGPEIAPEVLGTSNTRARTLSADRPGALAHRARGRRGGHRVQRSGRRRADSWPHPAVGVLVVGWITVPYLVSGLIAWWRRPVSRLGPLMLAAGFVTPLSLLPFADNPIWVSVGELFEVLPAAMYLHVFLAYPTGRLRGHAERITVVSGYVATLVLTVVKVMLGLASDQHLHGRGQPRGGPAGRTGPVRDHLCAAAVRRRAALPAAASRRPVEAAVRRAAGRLLRAGPGEPGGAEPRRYPSVARYRCGPGTDVPGDGPGARRLPDRPARHAAGSYRHRRAPRRA